MHFGSDATLAQFSLTGGHGKLCGQNNDCAECSRVGMIGEGIPHSGNHTTGAKEWMESGSSMTCPGNCKLCSGMTLNQWRDEAAGSQRYGSVLGTET